MAESTSRIPRSPKLTLGLPVYVPGDRAGEFWAHFRSGTTVKAVQGRVRSYPGLRSEAPPTQAFYAALTKIGGRSHVLDVGAGSGAGTQLLSESFDRVTAIEVDPRAVAFARELAPLATIVHADASQRLATEPAEFAIVADLLGQVASPEAVLMRVREALVPQGTLFLAEPLAYVAQRLSTPVRRAFSLKSIRALLVRSGFELQSVLCESGTFIGCLSHPARDAGADALVEATAALGAGEHEAAFSAFHHASGAERLEVRREAELGTAQLHLSRGRGDEAARALFRASELDPEDARPVAGLSHIARLTGALPHALKLALDAARLDPTDPSAAAAVARAADGLGHPDAFDAYRIAHGLCPDDPQTATDLARIASERQDYAFGIAVLERLRGYACNLDPALHLTLSWLLLAEGRTRDAVLEARVVSALMPNDPAVEELWRAIEESERANTRG